MANTKLADATPGTIVKINENSVPVEYIVLQQNFSQTGRVLLRRKNAYIQSKFNDTNSNEYPDSIADVLLEQTYKTILSQEIQDIITPVSIPYTPSGYNTVPVQFIDRSIFLLSATQLGYTHESLNREGEAIAYFLSDANRIVYSDDGKAVVYWTRSHYNENATMGIYVASTGGFSSNGSSSSYYIVPSLTLPPDVYINEDGAIITSEGSGTNTPLGQMAVGSVVKTKFNNTTTEFIVAQQGKPSSMYDDSCNGAWLLMKDIYQNRQWNDSNSNNYSASTINAYLNGEFLNQFDDETRGWIKQVKIPYVNGSGSSASVASGGDGLPVYAFLLSAYEVKITKSYSQNVPADGSTLTYFANAAESAVDEIRIANLGGAPADYFLRSPYQMDSRFAMGVKATGAPTYIGCADSQGIRPAFVLDANTLYVDSDGFLTTESGGESMFIPAAKLEQGVEYNFRVFPRNWQNQFQTGIDGSSLHMVVADGNEAEPDDSVPADVIPSYTGNSQIFGDGQKGYIELYDSGVLTLNRDTTVDIFLVGGGGGGSGAKISGGTSYSNVYGGSGGGGGYTATYRNQMLSKNTEYPVTIGAGGAYGPSSNGTHAADYIYGGSGGETSIGTFSVAGGEGGRGTKGGDGGSGGGCGGQPSDGAGGDGGSNGANGASLSSYTPGVGQGITTYSFMDSQFRLFAGGGGGGGSAYYRSDSDSSDKWNAGGTGGAGGGGNGLGGQTRDPNVAGQANTGGGGGGGAYTDAGFYSGGAGGSGLAIIRWGDWNAASANTTTEEVN